MIKDNFRANITQAKENFEKESININKKPYFLVRLDKHNFATYQEKKNKSNETIKSDMRYYGRLRNALRNLFERITNKTPQEDLFEEYKDIKPEQGTKDIQKEVTTRFNKAIKEKLWMK